ncbi:MAG: MBL fold metallo-hydrolase [Candidatus Hodarchaeales archaeon]
MDIEDFTRLTDHTAISTDGWTNIGGIALENFSVVVDTTARRNDGKVIRKKIEDFYGLPVKYLVLTHYHQDHINGRHAFKDLQKICSDSMPVNMDRITNALTFKDLHTIENKNNSVRIVHTGGHTSGSSFVHFLGEKIVFAGDLVFENIFPPFGADPTCNPEMWIAALKQIKAINPVKIVPGHGPIIDGHLIDKHISNLENIRQSIRNAIKENVKSREIEISDYHGELHQRWLNGVLSNWYPFYKIIDDIPVLIEEIEANTREYNAQILSKMTIKELEVIAKHLGKRIKGNKDEKIQKILDFISARI